MSKLNPDSTAEMITHLRPGRLLALLCLAATLWLFTGPGQTSHADPACSLSAISEDVRMCQLSPAVSPQACHELAISTLQLPDSCLSPPVRTLGALELFDAACERGYGESCAQASNLIVRRHGGIDQNFPRAASYADKACAADHADGCNMLAFFYVNGAGVEGSIPTARAALKKACALGSAQGCAMMADLPVD